MTPDRFDQILGSYCRLRIGVLGDFCLDRYLEIDPARSEQSIETGLPVHNVVNVRAQPGAAGTVLSNLVALGVGTLVPIGFCGEDGEGYELTRALGQLPGISMEHFITTPSRRTFTYCKPLVLEPEGNPRELSRLDSKNWKPTPLEISARIIQSLTALEGQLDALIVMDQVDLAETGVVTSPVLPKLRKLSDKMPVLADSRRSLGAYPPVIFKMNAAELGALLGGRTISGVEEAKAAARELAERNGHSAFVTMAEKGIVGAAPTGELEHIPALPVRGPIDVVGAGDSVTANLAAALAAGAELREAITLAILASSLVVHQLGTTGVGRPAEMRSLLPTLEELGLRA